MEQLNLNVEQNPEDPAYIEEMAKKGEAAVNAGNTHRDGDEGTPSESLKVPEKFMTKDGQVNTEALLKSYEELQKKLGSQNQAKPEEPAKPEAEPAKAPEGDEAAAAKDVVESKGFDFNDLTKEYIDKGELSNETYDKLAKSGLPKNVVDQYIEGQKALSEKFQVDVMSTVGGQESYSEMTKWASDNLSPQQLDAFNRAVSVADMEAVKFAVQGLKAQFDRAVGSPAKRQLMGNASGSGESTKPFMSRTQYVDAIKDARYDRDSAYRAEVLSRLKVSEIF